MPAIVIALMARLYGAMDDNDKPALVVDFVGGAVGHRLRFGGGRGQDLPKACGLTKGGNPSIVDATAGLGRDAFLLASLGCEVTLIERVPAMHALLAEGLERARDAGPEFAEIIARMTLLAGDAKDVLQGLSPDVVLVDPMHPPRKNSALVKQDMRVLREIVGADPDARELMDVALSVAKKRVVLKWPLRGDPLPGLRAPSHQIIGKSTRYDVFMVG
jgi:16S rRNA (guanine1516-N2)-methyltransferase